MRMANLKRIWDYLIPALLSSYIVWSWYVATFEIGGLRAYSLLPGLVGWLLRTKRTTAPAVVHLVAVSVMMFVISNAYLRLITIPADHSIPPAEPPASLLNRKVPFQCFKDDGSLEGCMKGRCGGRWKPPRAHHCSTCGVCRVGFDHHCPWIGNCVTSKNKGDFVTFLLITPIAIVVAYATIVTKVSRQILEAYRVSTTDPWILENWWGWRWSWVCLGGPPGRYLTAIVFGYREMQRANARDGPIDMELGTMVREPSLRLLFLVLMGLVLAWFTAGLALRTLYDVGRGLTSVDTMREAGLRDGQIPPRLVWIPLPSIDASELEHDAQLALSDLGGGACCEVFPEERPYDLGWKRNLAALWGTRSMAAATSNDAYKGLAITPTLNPSMLQRMRATLGLEERSGRL